MPADSLDALFAAIRSACSSPVWSQGVELARAGAVQGERSDEESAVLRVATRGGLVSPSVHLEFDPPDWSCDCASREDVCEHVAAAVIALRQARRSGAQLPGAREASGRIAVRLSRRGGALHFERAVVTGEREEILQSTLAAVTSGRVDGPAFLATPADLALERALGTRLRGELPRGVWPAVLAALASCPDVTLDGAPVRASAEPVGFVGRLEDAPEGFRLRARRDPRVVEVFEGEIARLDDATLCPLGASLLSGRELEELTRGRIYRADEAAELATEVLPSLRERIPVEIATDRLPRTSAQPPRIALSVEREGDSLAVLALLVYGDPPTARVDAGRLVPLGGALPLRDEAAERALLRRLAQELELAPGRRTVATGGDALDLADRLRRWPGAAASLAQRAEGERSPSGAPVVAHFARAGALAPRFSARAGAEFALGDAQGRTRTAPAARVLAAWRAGESWVALDGGGFGQLPADWLARHGARVADLLAARGERGELPAAALPELAALAEELGEPVPEAAAALRDALAALADAAPTSPALPADLTASLRHYQSEGVAWLARLRDLALPALLADDMGLGKTLQALCAISGRTLVVAPTSVVANWIAEAERFRPALRTCIYHGAARALDPAADLTITSYALLRLDADALCAVEWDSVVLDESQAIKNADSQVARAAHRLPGRFRLALTGTPVENRLAELWSQFHFLSRGWLGSQHDFDERYARPIAAGDGEAAERLRARVRPFVLRRHKRDVAPELPPRTEVVLHVELGADERQVYDAVRAAARDDVAARFAAGGSAFQVLEALLRLRQAACDASLVPGASSAGLRSAKLEVLRENLEEAVDEGHKALVFSQWTSLLDRVEPVLRDAGVAFTRLDGSTRDRAAVVADFQSESGPPVLLVSLRAGGTGINLTAADTVFILDPWWNPAVEEQAADRAHRIGQTRPVMVYRLVSTDTVEERVLALQQHKRALSEAVLGAGAPSITREELLELLR